MRSEAGVIATTAGAVMVMAAIFRAQVDAVVFAGGLALVVGGLALIVGDLLADHPDEDRDELRRRRGAAGWEKPTAPPRSDHRPGGLPPRKG